LIRDANQHSSAFEPHNYNFVCGGIQTLGKASDVLPCILEAAIFASFDGDQWTDENVLWQFIWVILDGQQMTRWISKARLLFLGGSIGVY